MTKSTLRSQARADPLATIICNSSNLTRTKLKTALNASVSTLRQLLLHPSSFLTSFVGELSARAKSVGDDDEAYQQEATQQLGGFLDGYQGFKGLLAQLGSDKGLKNFDGRDPLQALLKDIVNAHKDILNSVTDIVNQLPVLGPVLGPSE